MELLLKQQITVISIPHKYFQIYSFREKRKKKNTCKKKKKIKKSTEQENWDIMIFHQSELTVRAPLSIDINGRGLQKNFDHVSIALLHSSVKRRVSLPIQ